MLLSKETKVLNLELSLLLAGQIGSMFLMLALGVGLIRGKILRTQDATVISKILLYAVVPCAILKSYEIDYSPSLLAGLGLSILGAVIAHAVFLLFERLLRRPLHLRPVESASLIYSNAGNLIFPLVYAALGEQWVFYDGSAAADLDARQESCFRAAAAEFPQDPDKCQYPRNYGRAPCLYHRLPFPWHRTRRDRRHGRNDRPFEHAADRYAPGLNVLS